MSSAHAQLQPILRWLFTDAALPAAVETRARMLLLDTVGCIVAGCGAAPVRQWAAELARLAPGSIGLPQATSAPLSPLAFAQLAATAATWDEACEGLARAHGRPGVPVIAAVLALAHDRELSLGRVLAAIVAGYETGGRLGEWLRIRPGMHVDAGWPALGAAAACAHALGRSSDEALDAIETAACQVPAGLYAPITAGATARNTYLAHAASLGLLAATSVASAIAAPATALDDYARIALGLDPHAARLAPAGEQLLLEGYLKPFAAVRHVHYGAAAALALRSRLPVDLDAIEAIELAVYPEALTYCGNRDPRTPIAAQFSLSFGLAAALRFGELSPAAYRDDRFNEAGLRRLERLVRIEADPALGAGGRRAARLRVRLTGGPALEERVTSVAGDADRPSTPALTRGKFLHYASALAHTRAAPFSDALLDGPLDASWPALWRNLTLR